MYDLEQKGGSILGGVLALLRERKANPPPPRDERLPPKPAGQTVGSFRRGLQELPEAIAANLRDRIRCAPHDTLGWQVLGLYHRVASLSRGLQELLEAIAVNLRCAAAPDANQCAYWDRSQSCKAGKGAPVTEQRCGKKAVWRKR